MGKKFNITGTCIPEKHYMVDTSKKIKNIINLIDEGEYFIINRPRQYGKTTTLFLLYKQLRNNDDYIAIKTSFEGIGDLIFENEKAFSNGFLSIVQRNLILSNQELGTYIENEKNSINSLDDLSTFITRFILKANKKVVLMIDEVDKSSNNQLFLSFLGMLRNKYLLRNEGMDYTFHSIILAGVHDIKTLKVKLRPNEEQKYNSPWNIATDFEVDMSFSAEEIRTMLNDYTKYKPIKLDKTFFSEKLYYYTSGYPFLVSKLCKIIDEKLMSKDELVWKNEYMDMAVKQILRDSNTNFDSLIKNIENNDELRAVVKKMILEGYEMVYNKDNQILNLGIMYGIFRNHNEKVKIHNRIYEQRIYNYLSSVIETSSDVGYYNYRENFINPDGTLNIRKVLTKFQEFMKHEFSKNRAAFLEHDARLVFLAFISPIINGIGFAFKEVTGGEERRFDIVITYEKKMYIIELKLWRGEEYHKKGLLQLGEYLEQYGLEEGYLLVFDFRKEANRLEGIEESRVEIKGEKKRIIEAFC